MTTVILKLDEEMLARGFIHTTKTTDHGDQAGYMELSAVMDLLNQVFHWEHGHRGVKLLSKFADSPYIAFGQNGARWVTVKEIPPAEYVLTIVTGKAYAVKLPRLIAKVSNMGSSFLFWTPDDQVTLKTICYPLVIGNISTNGWICVGTTRLACTEQAGIDKFIRAVIEAPTTGTYLSDKTKVEEFYQGLSEKWDTSVGAKHGRTILAILEAADTNW